MSTSPLPLVHRPRRRDALENRERILEAAVEVIAVEGVNVPLATIATAAQTGIATFYRSFPDRDALLVELGHRAFALVNALVDQIEEAGLTGLPALEQYLLGTLQIGDRLILPLNGGPALNDAESNEARDRLHVRLQHFVDQGREQGAIAADVRAMDVVVFGALINQPVRRQRGWRRIATRQARLFLAGLTTGRSLDPAPPLAVDTERLLAAARCPTDGAQTS